MPKYKVFLWQQRRIEMDIFSESQDEAENRAVAVLQEFDETVGDQERMSNLGPLDGITEIDNHDIKSIIVEEVSA